jgi:hypothetical protein
LSSCEPLAQILFIVVSRSACVLFAYSEAQVLKLFIMLYELSSFRLCDQMMFENRYFKDGSSLVTAVSIIQGNTSVFMFGFALAMLIFRH